MSSQSRLAVRHAVVLLLVAVMLIAPAGSLQFWQGWTMVGVFGIFTAHFVVYFSRHDPKLLQRRMERREPRRAQRLFKVFWVPLWVCELVLPGLDYRFGWSESVGGVPLVVMVVSWIGLVASWLLVFRVMRFNRFASSVVRVEEGQKVITNGPYRLVRHPMYSGFVLMILATPLAMGSYVALIPAVLLVPVMVYRLTDEERMLRKELAGYAEYCERVRYRLVPYVF
jgi:protein-S-isoprenylcysteine O-methyltransferase Ste14